MATNAARYRIALDNRPIQLFEFGLRRAQGPDGGLSGESCFYAADVLWAELCLLSFPSFLYRLGCLPFLWALLLTKV